MGMGLRIHTRCNPWDKVMDESVWCVLIAPPSPELRKKKAVRESPHRRIEGARPTRFTCPLGRLPCHPRLKYLLCCPCSALCAEYPQQVQRDARPDPDISYEA